MVLAWRRKPQQEKTSQIHKHVIRSSSKYIDFWTTHRNHRGNGLYDLRMSATISERKRQNPFAQSNAPTKIKANKATGDVDPKQLVGLEVESELVTQKPKICRRIGHGLCDNSNRPRPMRQSILIFRPQIRVRLRGRQAALDPRPPSFLLL